MAKREEVPKYLQTIRKGQPSKLVKTLALVETLSSSNENKEYLCASALGLVLELCDILNKDQGEARDMCLKIFFNLSSQPANNVELMNPQYGLPALLANVLSTAPPPAKITAFSILLNLGAAQQSANKLLNPLHGLMSAIIAVLSIGDKELSKYAISLLACLFMAPGGASALGSGAAKLLTPMTHILLNNSGSLQGKTVSVVRRFAETAAPDVRIAASAPQLGLLNALLLIANDRSSETNHGKALQAIKFILSEEASVASVAVTGNGLIEGISKLCTQDSTAVDALAVLDMALASKISSCKAYLALADAGIGSVISEFLGDKKGLLDRKVWAVAALNNLLSVEDSRKLLGTEKLSLIPLLVSYVRSRIPELIKPVIMSLSIFATDESLIPQMTIPKYELLHNLTNIISTDKADLRYHALGFLQNAAASASVREEICSYRLGLMQHIAPILEEGTGETVFMALNLLYVLSKSEEDQVWFSAPDLGILPVLVKLAGGENNNKSPDAKNEKKYAYTIIRNMSKTPANRHYMASSKVCLIPFLIEKCKGSGKKKSELAIETLANIAEDSCAVCDAFSNYEFYQFLVDIVHTCDYSPSKWSAESVESIALTLLMHVSQWPQSHPPLLKIADTVPTLNLLAAGKCVQGVKAVLALALLLGSSEDPADESLLADGNICLRTVNTVFIDQARSSRNLTIAPSFPLKVTLRALWMLSLSDINKITILASPKLIKDLCGALTAFINTPQSARFSSDYEIAKRVTETILDVLLSLTMAFTSSSTLLASDWLRDPESLRESLKALNSSDINIDAQQTAALLSWRLSNLKVDEEEAIARNFIAIIYSWPVSLRTSPELIECFALSLKSMNYNVVLIENGRCKNMPDLSSWDLPGDVSFPANILARCSAAVVAVSSSLNNSPSCRLIVQTAVDLRSSDGLDIEFISLEPDFSLECLDKKLGKKCCSSWLRSVIGKNVKIRPLYTIANIEPVSNKIGESFDGIKELRGAVVSRRKKKPVEYSKKDPRGNERRYEIAWGILQVPNKAKKIEELMSLIASIGVYNAMDLQLCDFDDLVCISKLLKKVQMRNFNEMVFDKVE